MNFLSGLIVGSLLTLVLSAVGIFLIWRNNKKKIANLIKTAKEVGVVLGE